MHSEPQTRPRFSWPMRIFLTVIVVDMVFHSLANVADYQNWRKELEMPRLPLGLPSWPEIARLSADEKKDLPTRLHATVLSTAEFVQPWPRPATQKNIRSADDAARFGVAWLANQFSFAERLLGLSQNWIMFSPSVGKQKELARARLLFADGSCTTIRLDCDPPDLIHYTHVGGYRVQNYEDDAQTDAESRTGYCNLLAHRHPANERGSRLQTIYLYKFIYKYPPPEVDAGRFLKAQTGPPDWDKQGPFYQYHVSNRAGHVLKKEESSAAQKFLATK